MTGIQKPHGMLINLYFQLNMKYICYKCADGVYYTNKELTETSPNSSDAYEFSEENSSDAYEFSEEEKELLEKNIVFDKTCTPNYVVIEKE